MLEIHHFSYGWVTPVLAYLMSLIGSLLGLRCTARARTGEGREGWLIAAAVAIGGTGIWVMHFVAMLGFSIHGADIRYNVPLTLFSAALAVGVVWVGLSIVAREPIGRWPSLLIGGTITGIGVSVMHYCGMYAMNTDAMIDYNPVLVVASVAIGIVASIVALWFTLVITGLYATVGAALIMGVAVCGMHYTGMAAMSAHEMDHMVTPSGSEPMDLLAPLMIIVSIVTLVLLIHVGLTEVDERSMMPDPQTVRPQAPQPPQAAWSLQSNQAAAKPVRSSARRRAAASDPQQSSGGDYRTAGLYEPASDYRAPGRHEAGDLRAAGQYTTASASPRSLQEQPELLEHNLEALRRSPLPQPGHNRF
ncbi:MHYT domain-containing protein [Nocardia sp. NBC_00511]|uniref:MHYT domain-containing protein n=1 Tax=Nocardia sp. NBC_00511 TaxID=2903591 RepID=UPI00386B76CF